MESLYTYLLLGSAAGCALGGLVGWWLRKQGEATRRHDVEVYYREALKISESARDRAREEADQLGDRLRDLREEHEVRASEVEELRAFLEGVKQASTDTTDRVQELESELEQLRSRLKERDSVVRRLQKEWKDREAKLVAERNGHGELEQVQAELQAMTLAREASGSETERLRKRLREVETQTDALPRVAGNGNGSREHAGNGNVAATVAAASNGNGSRTPVVSGNGAPTWLIASAKGDQDDLKSIHGLGPVLERGLNKLGVYYFRQVARMTDKDVEWIAPRLHIHPARILRADWAEQAKECHRRKYKENL